MILISDSYSDSFFVVRGNAVINPPAVGAEAVSKRKDVILRMPISEE